MNDFDIVLKQTAANTFDVVLEAPPLYNFDVIQFTSNGKPMIISSVGKPVVFG